MNKPTRFDVIRTILFAALSFPMTWAGITVTTPEFWCIVLLAVFISVNGYIDGERWRVNQNLRIDTILFFLCGVLLIHTPDDRGWVEALINNIGVMIVFIAGAAAAEPESE